MIDKRTAIGKMIDDEKVVYVCILCNRRLVGDSNTHTDVCPSCKNVKKDILVMDGSLIVRK